MAPRLASTLFGLVAALAFFLLATPTAAFTESYCSPQNTANNDVYTWDWQSNGNCTGHCGELGTFAFAVIQWKSCYCSNYIPRQQVNINKCRKDCPGFPAEHCGSQDDGLYIYIQANGQPSGTQGGSQPSSAPPSQAPPKEVTVVPPTVTRTVLKTTVTTQTPVVIILPPSHTSASASPSSSFYTSTKPSSPQQSSQTPEPQTSKEVVTESGIIITRTIVQTPPPGPTTSTAPVISGSGGNGSNVGAIAGGVAGGVVGLFAIIGGICFFLWKRHRKQQEDGSAGGSSGGITRNTSTMSRAGLLGGAPLAETQYPPRIATNMSTQNSRYGADQDSISPISNRRNSQPLMIDSRLNPNAVMTFAGANHSRESVGSLDDSRDYGRQLNVRNPDP